MKRLIPLFEHVVKKPVWDCRMCGQCVLHSTGMTCPMTCPKTLRNGPCGGVREDGGCEVKPEMTCVWLKAERRSHSSINPKRWEAELNHLRPPVNNQLKGTSSWINLVTGADRRAPAGWSGETLDEVHDTDAADHALATIGTALVEIDDPASLPEGFHA
jgi:hypothetical protein